MRVVVLGAGFGGLELTTRLSDEFGRDVEVVLIDQTDGFVFGFSKLEVMFGRATAATGPAPVPRLRQARRAVRAVDDSLDRPGRQARRDRRGDVRRRRARRRARRRPAPRGDARAGRGRARVLHRRRRVRAARRAGRLRRRARDRRRDVDAVQVPAGAERDRAPDARLPHRPRAPRRVEIALVMPLPVPIPPSPDASEALLAAFAERGIDWHPGHARARARPGAQRRVLGDDGTRCRTTCSSVCRCTARRRSSRSRA